MKNIRLLELEELINIECNRIKEVVDDGVTLRRIKPYKTLELDEFGCNWGVNIVGDRAYADSIISIINALKKKHPII